MFDRLNSMVSCMVSCFFVVVAFIINVGGVGRRGGNRRGFRWLAFEACEERRLCSADCVKWNFDVNHDESLTPADVVLVVNAINNNPNPNSVVQGKGSRLDASGDGKITSLDALLVASAINASGVGAPVCAPNITVTGPAQIVGSAPNQYLGTIHWDGAEPFSMAGLKLSVSGAEINLQNWSTSDSAIIEDLRVVLPDETEIWPYAIFNNYVTCYGTGVWQVKYASFGSQFAGKPTGDWDIYGQITPLVSTANNHVRLQIVILPPDMYAAIKYQGPETPVVTVDPVAADAVFASL